MLYLAALFVFMGSIEGKSTFKYANLELLEQRCSSLR